MAKGKQALGKSRSETTGPAQPLRFRPLYSQVREALVGRLIDGSWPPGMHLPSEHQLAAELGVSQGTVRKALDAMAADNLLVRRQGRGTFVAEPEDGRMVFQFFKIVSDDGRRSLPDSSVIRVGKADPTPIEQDMLQLSADRPVWFIDRTRELDGRTIIAERIYLPADRFPDLDRIDPFPNNVYALYAQAFGLIIARAEERLKATTASKADAARLDCRAGEPLIEVSRTGYALDETPVEWRVSRCLTDQYHYAVSLK